MATCACTIHTLPRVFYWFSGVFRELAITAIFVIEAGVDLSFLLAAVSVA